MSGGDSKARRLVGGEKRGFSEGREVTEEEVKEKRNVCSESL